MTIVCGTDFSTHADQASRAAGALAKRLGQVLTLVHVVEDPSAGLAPPLPESRYEPLQGRLHAQGEALAREFGVEVRSVVLHGVPHQALPDVASGAGATLLVVSALGSERHPRWLAGSVAERVAQGSPLPVLVVRDAASIEACARDERPLQVMVGVDLGPTSRAALSWVEQLRRCLRCDVDVVQVAWPLGEHRRFDVTGPPPLQDMHADVRALLERDLRAWADSLPGQGDLRVTVSPGWGRIDAHLTALAADARSDLLVVGTHQHAWAARVWQGSVSRGVIHYATSNVVCVPCAAIPAQEALITTIRSVLVPTDLSALGNQAVPVGYGLVAPGGVLHLLHVLVAGRDQDSSSSEQRLRALIPNGAAARGISTEIHVLADADANTGIWHAANRLGVDAVCMSTHGRSGPSQLVLGSQALEVLRRVHQPVVLVKERTR